MRCKSCDSPLPEGAAFCVECGAPARAATGRTVALEAERPAEPAPPADLPAPPRPPAPAGRRRRSLFDGSWRPMTRGFSAKSSGVFMIGLGLLFFTGTLWPGILALFGLTGAMDELDHGNVRGAAAVLLFMGGLAVLFATGLFWPGILVLIGLVALLDKVG